MVAKVGHVHANAGLCRISLQAPNLPKQSCLPQKRLYCLRELRTWHHARLTPYGLAFVKQNEGRNALHSELLGYRLVAVYVNLDDFELALMLGGHLFQDRRHSFARATPIGVKINQYGHARAIDEFGK
jgi:hypothetical protein